jgi:hypothetical protein
MFGTPENFLGVAGRGRALRGAGINSFAAAIWNPARNGPVNFNVINNRNYRRETRTADGRRAVSA